jgi:hypothetical protein
MNKKLFLLPAILLLIAIVVISCKKKETITDPNQAAIDRLKLADEGVIRLNDKLSAYFPQYPKSDSIIKPLQLNNTAFHTSGTELPGNHGRGYDFEDFGVTGDVTESYDLPNNWAAGVTQAG